MNTPHCFVARPISVTGEQADRYADGKEHWQHVHDHLIVPALHEAGYETIDPAATGANNIHAEIIEHLRDTDLVLADFSTLNANVLYEAGIRTAVNKPLVLIAENGTKLPFDTTTINTLFYDPALSPWDLKTKIPELTEHIKRTKPDENALWRHFGVALSAAKLDTTADPGTATIHLLEEKVDQVAEFVALIHARLNMPSHSPPPSERSRSWRISSFDQVPALDNAGPEEELRSDLEKIVRRLHRVEEERDALEVGHAPAGRISEINKEIERLWSMRSDIEITIANRRGHPERPPMWAR